MKYETYEGVPQRSPLDVIDVIRPYIENKIVCEIGCKRGDILYGISKYASKCFGYDIEEGYILDANKYEYECPTEIILGDFFEDLNSFREKIDVFYSFSHGSWYVPWFESVHNRFPSSVIITAADPGNKDERGDLLRLNNKYCGEVFEFEYDEPNQRADTFMVHVWSPER